MRLKEIRELKISFSKSTQLPLPFRQDQPACLRLTRRDPLRRRLVRSISLPALLLHRFPALRISRLTLSFPCDLLCLGERFSRDASLIKLLNIIRGSPIRNVLIPGSSVVEEDAQFWLRRGVRQLSVVDVWDRGKAWEIAALPIKNFFGADVVFRHCPIESTSFEDASVDLIASEAVLEHVRNITAFCNETARILRPGGFAWHSFGPLYFTYGGDHCITYHGKEHGYDHLLLDEDAYRAELNDEVCFKDKVRSDCRHWAFQNQFSFLTASEYLQALRLRFEVLHVLVKISNEGLWFRNHCPEKWGALRAAGLAEEDLLVKSLLVILRKKQDMLESNTR